MLILTVQSIHYENRATINKSVNIKCLKMIHRLKLCTFKNDLILDNFVLWSTL